MSLEVSRSEIEAAADRISSFTRRTPVVELGDVLDGGYRLSLKLDHLQPTGSFKVRGAFSVLTARDVPPAGVTAASGGNFGIAAAYACSRLGFRATIFVPETSPPEKIDGIGQHGAEVRVIPGFYDQAMRACESWAEISGAFNAHAYDQPEVVAGQGTSAFEITAQLVDVDTILVAVGGGGLIGGIASWCRDDVRVVSTEPHNCRSMHAALEAGGPTEVDVGGVASSSLGARSIGEYAWYASRWVDEAVLVTDEDIIRAQSWIWHNTRLAVEPAAATTVAALMAGAYAPKPNEHVVAMISGANVNPATIA
jgi:threonine dehydratase